MQAKQAQFTKNNSYVWWSKSTGVTTQIKEFTFDVSW
jgi:hypothetical protein